MPILTRLFLFLFAFMFALAFDPHEVQAIDQPTSAPAPQSPSTAPLPADQLQELVAPIALYPDALVAQILAASTYPTQIVEAERFLQQNPNLKGAELGTEVDKQAWDPSVKALTQFPSVVADMDKNLTWTSELGDANSNQQADVMSAVQTMREKAQKAGTLKSTSQQSVTNQGSNVSIQPVNPTVVYVPVYDPGVIYGYPVGLWPGFYPWWGPGPYITFGIGFGIAPFFGYGWGWRSWGMDWHGRGLVYGGHPYAFRGRSFYNRTAYFHGNYRGGGRAPMASYSHGDRGLRGYGGGSRAAGAGAFGTANHGAETRANASRGRSSMGGGRGHGSGRH